jgi:Sulfatase
MAAEGMKMTRFYVAAPVCTPSRAALMTGCYPKRIDMAMGSNFGVLLAGVLSVSGSAKSERRRSLAVPGNPIHCGSSETNPLSQSQVSQLKEATLAWARLRGRGCAIAGGRIR